MKRFGCFLFILMSVCGALGLIYEGILALILHRFTQGVLEMEAATIGIIGGADGPTAVFVSAAPAPIAEPVIFALLLIVGVIGLICLKRIRKS